MSGKYWITGVQLGMLRAFSDKKELIKTLDEIETNQFIGSRNFIKRVLMVKGNGVKWKKE